MSANEIALLFEGDPKTIRKHINNDFEENEVEYNSNTQKMRIASVEESAKRGELFKQWTNSILKQYLFLNCTIL